MTKKTEPRFRSLHIMTGFVCNNQCVFCCDHKGKAVARPDGRAVRRTLEENVDLGFVVFTHLEPTLNPDLVTWVGWARELGYETVMLVTNGRQLAKRSLAERLVDAGMNCVAVSIHAHFAELHDAITRREGSFAQAVAGIERIRALRRRQALELKLLTTVTALNVVHLPAIVGGLEAHEADSHGLNAVFLEGDAATNASQCAISYGVLVEAFVRCLQPGRHRNISLSEIPLCRIVGRVPPEYVGLREEFHFALLGAEGRLLGSARAIPPPGRGFRYGVACDACVLRPFCDGVPEAYLARFGWEGFAPPADTDLDGLLSPEPNEALPPFMPVETVRAMLASSNDLWKVTEVTVNANAAMVEVRVGAPHWLRVRLVLSPLDPDAPAYVRTRRFNVGLQGRGYSRREERLARSVIRQLLKAERRWNP